MALLDKVMKSGVLRSNIGSKGYLLLLDGPKGSLEVSIVNGSWLGRRTRSNLTSKWGERGCRLNSLGIARYLIKVSSVK